MARTGSARGVYAISVAAELTGTAVQNLRVYERHGLVEPTRTGGGTRRYSEDDLDRIRRVLRLLAAGLNLAGIALVLELEDDNDRLRRLTGERQDERTEAGR
ncbi:MAG TPA: MerR family transcriptional regulator [Nocardioidaceae bacterium]|nr:MerR family transcriptional regulator [Nocardioidaceae bacterium]